MPNVEHLLVTFDPCPRAWNMYPSREAAEADIPRASERAGKPASYMTWDEYEAAQTSFWLEKGTQEITLAEFDEMLNVLPPKAWQRWGDFERFCMEEFTDGPITIQFARYEDRAFTKYVNYFKRDTWISRSDVLSYIDRNPA